MGKNVWLWKNHYNENTLSDAHDLASWTFSFFQRYSNIILYFIILFLNYTI